MFRARQVVLKRLLKHPDQHGQQRYLTDNQRCHLDRIRDASLHDLRSDDEIHMAVMPVISKGDDTQYYGHSGASLNSKVWQIARTTFSGMPPTKDKI